MPLRRRCSESRANGVFPLPGTGQSPTVPLNSSFRRSHSRDAGPFSSSHSVTVVYALSRSSAANIRQLPIVDLACQSDRAWAPTGWLARRLVSASVALVPISCRDRSAESRQKTGAGPVLLDSVSGRILAALQSTGVFAAERPAAALSLGLPAGHRACSRSHGAGQRDFAGHEVTGFVTHTRSPALMRDQFERKISPRAL